MMYATRTAWLLLASLKFLIGLWFSRRPDVMDKLLDIGHRLTARKAGV